MILVLLNRVRGGPAAGLEIIVDLRWKNSDCRLKEKEYVSCPLSLQSFMPMAVHYQLANYIHGTGG